MAQILTKPVIQKKRYTIKDYQLLDEGAPYQLINGELIMTPSPTTPHQERSVDIIYQIRHFLKANPIGKVFSAPTDVYFDEHNALQPDIIYISRERIDIIKKAGIYGAPDMIIEIQSPSTGYYDTNSKKKIYERYGVKEYWLIDPADNEVIGYELVKGKYKEFYRGTGKFTSKVLKLDISVNL
ncbi:MAG: Uma2 family endonuclease [Cytophagales bacterium]|nr:Uma2 family endonuclease [Cytophagales bacterium]